MRAPEIPPAIIDQHISAYLCPSGGGSSGKHARAEASPRIWGLRWHGVGGAYCRRRLCGENNLCSGELPGKCLRRHAGRRGRSAKIWSLPSHSGAGVCRSEWDPGGDCARQMQRACWERRGGQSTLWAPGLDDPNQDCVAVWGSITDDQQRGALFSPDGYMACGHGMRGRQAVAGRVRGPAAVNP